MSENQTLITISELSMSYEKRILFQNLNFEIKQGDFISIIGPNGTGKSTLLHLLMKKIRPRSGMVNYNTSQFSFSKIGFVPQSRNISADYPLNIYSFVGLRLFNNMIPWLVKSDHNKIDASLDRVSLSDKSDQLLSSSSGGEQQRAYIAQALVTDPKMIILDEPTNGLDERSKNEVMAILKKLQTEDKVTIVLVTHDPDSVKNNSTKVLQLNGDGTFVFGDHTVLESKNVKF